MTTAEFLIHNYPNTTQLAIRCNWYAKKTQHSETESEFTFSDKSVIIIESGEAIAS